MSSTAQREHDPSRQWLSAAMAWLSIIALVGCQHFTPVVTDVFSPAELSQRRGEIEALLPVVAAIEANYQKHHQVDGVTFVSLKTSRADSPRYATDNDNAIFTGMYLAAASYRYAVTESARDLVAVESALEGVYRLTHVSGVPGVVARWTFPLANSWEWIDYDRQKSREVGNGWVELMDQGQLYEHDGYAFYTRTTKDQLCGIVFGLAVTQQKVADPSVRMRVAEIVSDLITRLRETGWSLADQTGATGTNAHKVDAPLRLALEALHLATSGVQTAKPSSRFFSQLALHTAYYNRSITRTFAWNLNALNAHTLLLLREQHDEVLGVVRWEEKIWRFLASDENPHFAALHIAWSGEPMPKAAWLNLKRRASDNYYKFFAWEKDPNEWWREERPTEGPGLDVLLPYWMLRYYTQ